MIDDSNDTNDTNDTNDNHIVSRTHTNLFLVDRRQSCGRFLVSPDPSICHLCCFALVRHFATLNARLIGHGNAVVERGRGMEDGNGLDR